MSAALQSSLLSDGAREMQIVDVREPAEFTDALGHLPGAELLPLSQPRARVGGIDAPRAGLLAVADKRPVHNMMTKATTEVMTEVVCEQH